MKKIDLYWFSLNHSKENSNIFKNTTFVRELKIQAVHPNQLEKDYPNFGLTYFYKYKYPNGIDKCSKNDIFGLKKADQQKFHKGGFDLKGNFPIKLANIFYSTRNILNESEKITATFNLETLLAGEKEEN